ncbi:hypothetical protein VTI74DRAFT_7747 [Chaetomium olivicolor]
MGAFWTFCQHFWIITDCFNWGFRAKGWGQAGRPASADTWAYGKFAGVKGRAALSAVLTVDRTSTIAGTGVPVMPCFPPADPSAPYPLRRPVLLRVPRRMDGQGTPLESGSQLPRGKMCFYAAGGREAKDLHSLTRSNMEPTSRALSKWRAVSISVVSERGCF